ncbi:MAG: hypothetical protein JWR10_2059 [Rubritepida sp.]|nr:hypothetical protein [Rubritepida sp.]
MDQPKTSLSYDELLARMQQIHWFHSIALRPGLTTFGPKTELILAHEEQALLGCLDLHGRTVLDIGAWNGHFSFAAKRRGAARVLATDSYTWTHPHFKGQESFELARAELGLEIDTQLIDPTEITGDLGLFDVVLFLGVFYHLFDPIDVIQRLRSVTGQVLMIETHQDALEKTRPGMVFYPGTTLGGDATNWWGPNPPLMLSLLKQIGFARVMYREYPGEVMYRGLYAAFTPEADPAIAAGFGVEWRDLEAPGVLDSLVVAA